MAEALAVFGGAAAAIQILHYSFESFRAASALSHNVRHAPEKIEAWVNQVAAMCSLLDEVQHRFPHLDNVFKRLLTQCRNDTTRLASLLLPFRSANSLRKHSTLTKRTFVVRREAEVERLVSSFDRTFNTLTSYFFM
jgi:hypothetical protein